MQDNVEQQEKYISVIVPVYNGENTIESCLQAIRDSVFSDYELIVVDDGSKDATAEVAQRYADKLIRCNNNTGKSNARNTGIKNAQGEIIVNIDADIVIYRDTLQKIASYLREHTDIDAITGLLSKQHPHDNFCSQYKNLYMHYIFRSLPQHVTFLFGSICAFRNKCDYTFNTEFEYGVDTEFGQRLIANGKKIVFKADLEVIHLKKYRIITLLQNDFKVPFSWAKIFVKYSGFKQLGRHKTGFAHSSKLQIISVCLAPLICICTFGNIFGNIPVYWLILLTLSWLLLNLPFTFFLRREKGLLFSILGLITTFFDNIIMNIAILCGFAKAIFSMLLPLKP